MPPINVDVMFRDFQRYTGDGLPNAPAGHPLPVGDPTSGVYNPTKRDFRELGHASLDAAVQAQEAAEAAIAAMADVQGATMFAANRAALLANPQTGIAAGAVFATRAEGFAYQVVASDPDLTTAGGVGLRVLPRGDGAYDFGAWGPAADGVTDDSALLQAALNRLPGSGGTLVLPRGRIRLNSGVYRKLNAAGALGRGITIRGSSEGNTTIVVGMDDAALTLDGPDGSFASGLTIVGLRFEAATPRQGIGLRLRGIVRSDISVYTRDLRIGVECEAFLINTVHFRSWGDAVGIYFRKDGHFGGAWGSSGCNENFISGDIASSGQYGMIADTIRGVTMDMHIERCGNENVAGGGVHNTDRGGLKFIDPVGTLRLRGSSEDCGDNEDGQSGNGAVLIQTTGAVAQPWTAHFEGWNFFGTLDRPDSYVRIAQAATAGAGVVVFDGASFSDHPTYVPNASRPKIGMGATAANLRCVLDGVSMTHASTEMTFNNFTDYTIVNSPDIGSDAVMHTRGAAGRGIGHYIAGNYGQAALAIAADQKVGLNSDGSRWMRWNSSNNSIEFGRGLTGSEVVKHTIPLT